MPSNLCGLRPSLFFFGRKPSKLMEVMKKPRFPRSQKTAKGSRKGKSSTSFQSSGNFFQMMELRKKIIAFREMIDLSPCSSSMPINKLVILTMTEISNLYPELLPQKASELKGFVTHQVLAYFCRALQAMGDESMRDEEAISNNKNNLDKLVEITITTLNAFIKSAKEKFDMADEEEEKKDNSTSVKATNKEYSYSSDASSNGNSSPVTPTSVLPADQIIPLNSLYTSPLLLQLRVQAVGKLNPLDVKRLAFNVIHNVGAQKAKLLNKKHEKVEELDAQETSPNETAELLPDDAGGNVEVIELLLPLPSHEDEQVQLTEALYAAVAKALPENPNSVESPTEMEIEETESPPPFLDDDIPLLPPLPPPLPAKQPSNIAAIPPPPQPPPLPPKETCNEESEQVPPPSPKPTMTRLPSLEVAVPPTSSPSPSSTPSVTPPPTPPSSPVAVHFVGGRSPPPPPPHFMGVQSPPPPLPHFMGGQSPPPPPPHFTESRSALSPPPSQAAPPMMLRSVSTPCPPPPPPMGNNPDISAQSLSPQVVPVANGFRPPPPAAKGAGPPPPPPGGGGKALLTKKGSTKLKRSSQMGNLYRVLKGKVEGISLPEKSANGKKSGGGSSGGGGQSMADALAEMTKRSAYFQQIEGDVEKYEKAIKGLQPLINNYKTKDMDELLKVHKEVEIILEKLTDETQVLARFEGFPSKKLEAMRMAAALYTKLQSILTELRTFKIEPPVAKLLEKVDRYFNKVKGDLDALERTKDDEAKKFKNHGIEFDFAILIQVKEAIVDVSSNCMELALTERKELKGTETTEVQKKASSKMLWKVFEFAFRVYTFAGGHDDRSDRLTKEIANEIQNDMENN